MALFRRRPFLEAQLYGVHPIDPASLTAAVLGLGLVALMVGVVPAWRASRMDPMTVLRDA